MRLLGLAGLLLAALGAGMLVAPEATAVALRALGLQPATGPARRVAAWLLVVLGLVVVVVSRALG